MESKKTEETVMKMKKLIESLGSTLSEGTRTNLSAKGRSLLKALDDVDNGGLTKKALAIVQDIRNDLESMDPRTEKVDIEIRNISKKTKKVKLKVPFDRVHSIRIVGGSYNGTYRSTGSAGTGMKSGIPTREFRGGDGGGGRIYLEKDGGILYD